MPAPATVPTTNAINGVPAMFLAALSILVSAPSFATAATRLDLAAGTHDSVTAFVEGAGQRAGVKIVGQGRSHTIVRGPLHFRGAFPELDELTVLCEDETTSFIDHAGVERSACVVFENRYLHRRIA
jgi:hypothetical protein